MKLTPVGAGGVGHIFFYPKSYFFCDLELCAKFQNRSSTPSGLILVSKEDYEEDYIVDNSGFLSHR